MNGISDIVMNTSRCVSYDNRKEHTNLIVDDHAMFRQVARSILKPYPNIEVVGEASDGDEAVVSVGQLKLPSSSWTLICRIDGVTAAH